MLQSMVSGAQSAARQGLVCLGQAAAVGGDAGELVWVGGRKRRPRFENHLLILRLDEASSQQRCPRDATVSDHGPCHIKDAGPCCSGPAAGAGVTCSPKGLFHEPARAIQCQFLPAQLPASAPLHGPLTVAPERPASCCRAAISNGSPTPSHQHSFPRLETRSETGS
jgi:hypothetical protein